MVRSTRLKQKIKKKTRRTGGTATSGIHFSDFHPPAAPSDAYVELLRRTRADADTMQLARPGVSHKQ